jgi:hypothetical protein
MMMKIRKLLLYIQIHSWIHHPTLVANQEIFISLFAPYYQIASSAPE